MVSDPVDFDLAPLSDLAVTVRVKDPTDAVTGHPGARCTSYLQAGDAVAEPDLPARPAPRTGTTCAGLTWTPPMPRPPPWRCWATRSPTAEARRPTATAAGPTTSPAACTRARGPTSSGYGSQRLGLRVGPLRRGHRFRRGDPRPSETFASLCRGGRRRPPAPGPCRVQDHGRCGRLGAVRKAIVALSGIPTIGSVLGPDLRRDSNGSDDKPPIADYDWVPNSGLVQTWVTLSGVKPGSSVAIDPCLFTLYARTNAGIPQQKCYPASWRFEPGPNSYRSAWTHTETRARTHQRRATR